MAISFAQPRIADPAPEARRLLWHAELLRFELSFDFDPAGRDADLETLRRLLM